MKRSDKKALIAQVARDLATQLGTVSGDNKNVEIGTAEVPITEDGTVGNVFGTVLARAGFGNGRKVRGLPIDVALETVLGLGSDENLPANIAEACAKIEAVTTDPKLGYVRRASKLAKALDTFATEVATTQIGRPVGRPSTRAAA